MDSAFSYGDSFVTEDILENRSSDKCRLCGLLTAQRCKRCGDYYCSEKCQLIDWPNHRYICFPIPPLVRSRDVKYEDIFPEKSSGLQGDDKAVVEKLHIILEKLLFIESKLTKLTGRNKETINESKHPTNSELDPQSANNDERDSCKVDSLDYSVKKAPQDISTTESDHVMLCAFRSTNRCAIRIKNPEADAAFRAVIEEVDKYGRDAPPLKSLPKVGSYAITLKSNKQYTRVKILNSGEDPMRVLFCDFGNTVCRKLEELRVISKEILNLPEYVVTVQLYNVPMFQYSGKILGYLKSFERKEYRVKYINENGNTYAELFDLENGQSVNDMVSKFYWENDKPLKTTALRQLSHESTNKIIRYQEKPEKTVEIVKENSIEHVMTSPFETHIFELHSCNFNVIVIDTSLVEFGYLSCIHKQDIGHLSKIQNYLNDQEFGTEPYEPKLNEYVIAKYENDWYRGQVVDIKESERTTYEVSYIDFLNEATLTSDSLRRYPKDLKIDCYTTLCEIDGLPSLLKPKQREFLKSNINVNDVIMISRVVEIIDKKVALIECEEILKRMRNEKLL